MVICLLNMQSVGLEEHSNLSSFIFQHSLLVIWRFGLLVMEVWIFYYGFECMFRSVCRIVALGYIHCSFWTYVFIGMYSSAWFIYCQPSLYFSNIHLHASVSFFCIRYKHYALMLFCLTCASKLLSLRKALFKWCWVWDPFQKPECPKYWLRDRLVHFV